MEIPGKPGAAETGEVDWSVDPKDPASRNYARWRSNRLFQLWDHWDGILKKINPHARFLPNMGGEMGRIVNLVEFGNKADYLTVDRQGRNDIQPPWYVGVYAKQFRAVLGNKPLGGGFTLGIHSKYRWMNSVQSNPELYIWMAEAIANGIRPSFGKNGGVVADSRWEETVTKLFTWHHRVERYMRNEGPVARVAVIHSPQTTVFYSAESSPTLGICQALIEARIPFEMVNEGLLDMAHIGQFKVLILPNIAALSDGQCAQLTAFVQKGGSLIATYATSLYTEWGEKRANFGLSDLFGATYNRDVKGPIRNAYMSLRPDPATGQRHPILTGFDGTNRIIGTIQTLDVVPINKSVHAPLTAIPPYPNLPMEEVYSRAANPGKPSVYLTETGKGRVTYFPGDLDRTFWEMLAEDHARLLHNVIQWSLNEAPVVTVSGPGILDVTVWKQRHSMTVHLVDCSNPMAMLGYYREFIPLPAQVVRLQIPAGKQIAAVKLLVSNVPVSFRESGGYVELTVPSVTAHEVVAIDLV